MVTGADGAAVFPAPAIDAELLEDPGAGKTGYVVGMENLAAGAGGCWTGGLKNIDHPAITMRHSTAASSERISIDISLRSLKNGPLW
jgi:hypothetical protein